MARIPDRPLPITYKDIQQTKVTAVLDYRKKYDGGAPILQAQIGYGLGASAPILFVNAETIALTSVTQVGLSPGKVYYFWARVRNSVGWSSWSPRSQVTLVAGARVRQSGVWRRAVPYVKVGGVWRVARPWTKIAGMW